jgi:hypothetical protein
VSDPDPDWIRKRPKGPLNRKEKCLVFEELGVLSGGFSFMEIFVAFYVNFYFT